MTDDRGWSSSVDPFYFGWYMEDAELWFWHECLDGLDVWKAPPPWAINAAGNVEPSLICHRCVHHVIMTRADYKLPPAVS